MYGMFTYIWLSFGGKCIGKYTIYGAYGVIFVGSLLLDRFLSFS